MRQYQANLSYHSFLHHGNYHHDFMQHRLDLSFRVTPYVKNVNVSVGDDGSFAINIDYCAHAHSQARYRAKDLWLIGREEIDNCDQMFVDVLQEVWDDLKK